MLAVPQQRTTRRLIEFICVRVPDEFDFDLLSDAHSFVIKSEAFQILILEAVSELTCYCPHRYQGGREIIFSCPN
jgi:hypothetical protein